ncbi:MAG: hypothetical protein KC486_20110 [Myxococcales bacterium]|nr:hypothetical protein [Myxococcales bacterium]
MTYTNDVQLTPPTSIARRMPVATSRAALLRPPLAGGVVEALLRSPGFWALLSEGQATDNVIAMSKPTTSAPLGTAVDLAIACP